jgi:hypothetical protein
VSERRLERNSNRRSLCLYTEYIRNSEFQLLGLLRGGNISNYLLAQCIRLR